MLRQIFCASDTDSEIGSCIKFTSSRCGGRKAVCRLIIYMYLKCAECMYFVYYYPKTNKMHPFTSAILQGMCLLLHFVV